MSNGCMLAAYFIYDLYDVYDAYIYMRNIQR